MASGTIKNPGWKLVWTNPNPSSSFAAQTVPLNLSDYSEIKVQILLNDTQYAQNKVSYMFFVDKSGSSFKVDSLSGEGSGGPVNWARREISADNQGITFSAGGKKAANGTSGMTTDNGQLIPYKIYAR